MLNCSKQGKSGPKNAFDLRTEIIKGKTNEEKKLNQILK